MNLPILTAGFDPTIAPSTPTNSQLLQMVQAAHVATGIGVIYWGQSAPDLVTYPDAETALWGKLDGSDVPTGEFFYFDPTDTWLPFTITALDGSKITNSTITANKLSTAGASAGDILYFNGTSWTLAGIAASIADNTLPIAKLVKPASGTGQVLYFNGSTLEWHNLTGTEILNLIANKAIAISKLAVGSVRYVLRTKADGSAVEYAAPSTLFTNYELSPLVIAADTEALTISSGVITLDAESGNGGPAFAVTLNTNITNFTISNLASGREVFVILTQDGTGGRTVVWDGAISWLDGISPTVSSGANHETVVRFVNLNGTIYGRLHSVDDSDIKESALYSIPTSGTPYHTFSHGLGARPRFSEWSLRCTHTGGDAGYVQGDTVPIHRIYDNVLNPVFTGWCNTTTIGVVRTTNAGAFSATINTPHKTTGEYANPLNTSKWSLVCHYSL